MWIGLFCLYMTDFLQALAKNIKGEITPEAKRRAAICVTCPIKEKRIYASFLNAKIEKIEGYVCKLCDCPLATKIFAQDPENICSKWK